MRKENKKEDKSFFNLNIFFINKNIKIMKKNFLLLMLMALLPYAGFALTLDVNQLAADNIDYGTAALPNVTSASYTSGTDYEAVTTGFYAEGDLETAIPVANLATTATGKYFIKVNGKGDYVGQTVYVDFWINGVAISASDVTISGTYTYTGSQILPTVTVSVSGNTLTKDTDYTIAYGTNVAAGTNAGSVTVTGINNFSGEVEKTFDIEKKAFTTANVTVTLGASDFIYNGDPQAPTVTVTDKTTNQPLAATDFAVKYDGNTDKPTNAKDDIQITVTGAGNYTTADIATTDLKYNISKATLLVTPKAEKDYDGAATLPTTNATLADNFTFQGFQKSEGISVITLNGGSSIAINTLFSRSGSTATKKDQGSYTDLSVDLTKLAATNYKFSKLTGTFKINKKAINVTVANVTDVPYGTADDDITYTLTVTTAASEAEATSIEKATKVTKAAEADGDGHYALTLSKDESAAAADLAVLDNYEITYGTGAYVTYAKGEIVIAIDESKVTLTKVYDGTVPTIPALTTDNLIISGLADGDDVSALVLPSAEIVGVSKNVGTYQVKLNGASYPGGNYTISPVASQYKITEKELTISIADQTVKKGALVADAFDATAFAMAGLVEADGAKDDIFALSLAAGIEDTDHKIATSAASGQNIELAVKSGKTEIAKNYMYAGATSGWNWADKKGTLIVTDAAAIVLDDAEDLTTVVTADADNAIVNFTARSISAEKWNVLVLPFEVTVKALSTAFGYAAVDVLDETATDGNVHFKLKASGSIAANTPFLIYPCDDKANLNQVTFTDVNVKKITNATYSVKDTKNNKFVGVYKETGIYGEKFRYLSGGAFYDAAKYTEASPAKIKPLRGYLDLSENTTAAAPTIFIEDIDGSVTAINVISGDVQKIDADGSWYTINGVKLDAAPTQKGVYIKNGKKFVIK